MNKIYLKPNKLFVCTILFLIFNLSYIGCLNNSAKIKKDFEVTEKEDNKSLETLSVITGDYHNPKSQPMNHFESESSNILKGHTSSIKVIVMSPNGNYLASGSNDESVKVWDVNLRKLKYSFPEFKSWNKKLIYSPNGKTLAYESEKNSIKLCNIDTGKIHHTLAGHTEYISHLMYSPNGEYILTASSDNTAKLWDVETGITKFTFTLFENSWSNQISYSPNGKTIAYEGENNTILLWNTENGKLRHTLAGHSDSISNMKYSTDGEYILTASSDKTVKLWNVKTGKTKFTFTPYEHSWSNQISYSPDGKTVAFEGANNTILLWDAENGNLRHTLTGHSQNINNLCYSPDGSIIYTVYNNKIKMWDVQTGSIYQTIINYNADTIFFFPDRQTLGYKFYGDTIKLWDTKDGKLLTNLRHSEKIASIAPKKDVLAVAYGKLIKLWNIKDGNLNNLRNSELQLLPQFIEELGDLAKKEITPLSSEIDEIYSELSDVIDLMDNQELKRFYGEFRKQNNSDTDIERLKDLIYSKSQGVDKYLLGELFEVLESCVQYRLKCQKAKKEILPTISNLIEWSNKSQNITLSQLSIKSKEIDAIEYRLKNFISSRDHLMETLHRTNYLLKEEILDLEDLLHKSKGIDNASSKHGVSRNFSNLISSMANIRAQSKASSPTRDRLRLIKKGGKRNYLPHDGLFIRRNNEFGTRVDVSIKDLIEQGVMIDHEKIRFDDFVASTSDLIPFPPPNEALSVTYGIAEIPLHQKPDPMATHFLEIALKTSNVLPKEDIKKKTPPVFYVFVVDISGSMEGAKLDTVKTSIRELFILLRPEDVIGIVSFDDEVTTVLKTTPKKNISVKELSNIISKIEASGGTDINLGLSYGLDEMYRYHKAYGVKQIFLFSDGNPTSGETNWINIRNNLVSKTRHGIHISTFSFGSDANSDEMNALAGMTGSRHIFVDQEHPNIVKDILKEELNRRGYLSAMNIQMQIKIDKNIPILNLYGHDLITDPVQRAAIMADVKQSKDEARKEYGIESLSDVITEEDGIRIFVPDLAINETYYIVLELSLGKKNIMKAIGETTIQYVDIFSKKSKQHKFSMFSNKSELPSELVVQHGLGLWTSEIIFYALQDLYEEDLQTAQLRIENHLKLLDSNNFVLYPEKVMEDCVTLRKFLSLSKNLGRMHIDSDTRVQNAYFKHELNNYGQYKSGFVRLVDY